MGAEGRKTKCLGRDQPGISPYVVPTHRLGMGEPPPRRRAVASPPRRGETTQPLSDFSRINLGMLAERLQSRVSAPLFSFLGLGWVVVVGGRS